jgi:hypothetical protein
MRPNVRAFLELCAGVLPCPEPVVEIGSKIVAGQEDLADLRPLFPGKTFIGCDLEFGPGVDRIEDVHDLTFKDGEVGTFVLADTLEHVADPIRGARELRRSLSRKRGLLLATSAMRLPIHESPNDYWRFTPEAFRSLCKGFGFAAVLYSGDPAFPHSVCIVAGFGRGLAAKTRKMVAKARRLDVHAPPHFDRLSAGLAHHFSERLVAHVEDPPAPSASQEGGLEMPFHRRGWVLTRDSWVRGWIRRPDACVVEIRVGGNTIHRGVPDLGRPDIDGSLGLPPGTAKGFRGQVQFSSDHGETIGKAELWGIDSEGVESLAAQSPPGIAVPRPFIEPGVILHSYDGHGSLLNRFARLSQAIRKRWKRSWTQH